MYEKDIDSLKAEFGSKAKDIIFSDLSFTKNKVRCPFPDHDDKTPSAKWYDNSNSLYCHGCHRIYDIVDHYEFHYGMSVLEAVTKLKNDLGYKTEKLTQKEINEYITEKQSEAKKMSELLKMFQFRHISEDTLKKYNIINCSEKNEDIIGITYKNNDFSFRSYQKVKLNSLKQVMRPEKDLLFNFENLSEIDDIIVTFDIIDFLTLAELGYENICNKSTKGNGFVSKYYDDLIEKESITLVFGNDVSEKTFNDIVNRIGNKTVKYKRLDDYHTINHAVVSGVNIKEEIKKANFIEIKSLKKLEDITFEDSKMDKEMRFGQNGSAMVGLDWATDGIREGTLSVIVGNNNGGKTTFVQQIICNVIEQGHAVFVYDGESSPASYKRKMYLKLVDGKEECLTTKKINIRPIKYPKPIIEKTIQKWHGNKLILKTVGEVGPQGHDTIFKAMDTSYRRYKTKLYVIDNLMSLLKTDADNKYVDQANISEELKRFAKTYNVAVILIVHPRKTEENATLKKTDISGTNDIANKADNILSIMRYYHTGEDLFDGKVLSVSNDYRVDMVMDLLKNREFGELGRFYFSFNSKTDKFNEIVNNELKVNNYNWQKFLPDDVDKSTFEKIKFKEKVMDDDPF